MPKTMRYSREVPLERCPLPACHRSQICLHTTETDCCHRLYMDQDEFYNEIADKIDSLTAENIARRPPGQKVKIAKEGTPLFERRFKKLYDMLRATDQANVDVHRERLAKQRPTLGCPTGGHQDW